MNSKLTPKSNQPDWMIVYVTHDIRDAHVVAGRLTHEGIKSLVHTHPGANALGLTLGALGEVKVLVDPSDYETACDILFPDEPDELPANTDSYIFGWDDNNDNE